MITRQEYLKRLSKMRRNVYMDGKLIDRSDPRMEGAVNAMATTYDLVDNPDFKNMKTC